MLTLDKKRRRTREGGSVLTLTLVLLIVVLMLLVTIVNIVSRQNRAITQQAQSQQAFHIAEGGADYALELVGSRMCEPEQLVERPFAQEFTDPETDERLGAYRISVTPGSAPDTFVITSRGSGNANPAQCHKITNTVTSTASDYAYQWHDHGGQPCELVTADDIWTPGPGGCSPGADPPDSEDEPPPETEVTPEGTYTVVVINNDGASHEAMQGVYATMIEMLDTIDPWLEYQKSIKAIKLDNLTRDLGCTVRNTIPVCYQSSEVVRTVREQVPAANAVVVVVSSGCANCGASYHRSRVSAVGSDTTPAMLAHQLGHAAVGLNDEYLGNLTAPIHQTGPNCFASARDCSDALSPYQDVPDILPEILGGSCSQGCHYRDSWRPSDGLMFGNYKAGYGNVETCEVAKEIERYIGETSPKFCARD